MPGLEVTVLNVKKLIPLLKECIQRLMENQGKQD